MSEHERPSAEPEEPKDDAAREASDTRKPYEPPRLTKKRSVARATLFTAMGPAMTGSTFMG
jgi:hypothetical protein